MLAVVNAAGILQLSALLLLSVVVSLVFSVAGFPLLILLTGLFGSLNDIATQVGRPSALGDRWTCETAELFN